jgi:hypothetical protein
MHLDAYFCLVCMKILIFLYTYDTVTSLFWGRDMRSTSAHLRTVRVLESHIEEMSQPQGNPYSGMGTEVCPLSPCGYSCTPLQSSFRKPNFFLDGLFGCSSF